MAAIFRIGLYIYRKHHKYIIEFIILKKLYSILSKIDCYTHNIIIYTPQICFNAHRMTSS